MGAMASQITSLTIVYSTVCSGIDQRKHQSFALLAFVGEFTGDRMNSPHKGPVMQKMFSFDDVIMRLKFCGITWHRMLHMSVLNLQCWLPYLYQIWSCVTSRFNAQVLTVSGHQLLELILQSYAWSIFTSSITINVFPFVCADLTSLLM